MWHIDHPGDPRLGDYSNLTDASAARGEFFIVEGILAVDRLLEMGSGTNSGSVRSVLLTPNRAATLTALISRCESLSIPVLVAPREVLSEVAGFDVHRGVLAAVNRSEQPSVESILTAARRIVVLEAVNDHENLGAIFRNAAALGIDGLILDDRCSDPLYRRSIRVSLGHVLSTPWCRSGPLSSSLPLLRQAGFRLVGLTPSSNALAVGDAATQGVLDARVAFVLGAEGPGLTSETLRNCDSQVRIPMSAGVDSLNVATSLAVVASFAAVGRSTEQR